MAALVTYRALCNLHHMDWNEHGQPVGPDLPDWRGAGPLPIAPMIGRLVRLDRMEPAVDSPALFDAFAPAGPALWTYMPIGPFDDPSGLRDTMMRAGDGVDPMFWTIRAHGHLPGRASGRPLGFAAWLRDKPQAGSVEIGWITLAPELQRTAAATEAMYLMMRGAFEAGYRRYEWKCDALNAPSRAAAQRLGFSYEGTFWQASVVKGRNRDTAWFAIMDMDWPRLQAAFEAWLDPGNFDADGGQIHRLSDIRASV